MILIVDDKQENLFSLKTLLQMHLYEVDAASSGEEALKKILKKEYALIILDVQMPGMDGYEVAENITSYSKTKNIPIIFLSAVNIDKRFITKGYTAGGVDYVTKPFDPDLLLLKVQTFVRLYMQAKELSDVKENLELKVEERTSALKQANKELAMSNAELEQYAYIASHDLQEPLRKIITFSNLITDRYLIDSGEAHKHMDRIINSTRRMKNLINDLLNYSKLSTAANFPLCNLNNILQETLADLEVSIQEKEAQVIVKPLPSIEVIPDQMRQVFQNIISNAWKFSRDGVGPVIAISSDLVEEKNTDAPSSEIGKFCRLTITDNGIGFDETYRDKIFIMFQRLHGITEYEGTGIGLSIVKKIVEKHHGLINAQSKKGEGSTFIIVLPVKQAAIAAQSVFSV